MIAFEWMLRALKASGVNDIFVCPGSEFRMLEARLNSLRSFLPRLRLCTSEQVAIGAASGYFEALRFRTEQKTSPFSVVILHGSVGLLSSAASIFNAYRLKVPILVIVLGTPSFGRVGKRIKDGYSQWGQDCGLETISASICKGHIKLTRAEAIQEIFSRATSLMTSGSMGPVVVEIPLETLSGRISLRPMSFAPSLVEFKGVDEDVVTELVAQLKKSRRPLLVSNAIGRYRGGLRALSRLSSLAKVPILSHKPLYANYSADKCSAFFSSDFRQLDKSDFVICIEADVPWYPDFLKANSAREVWHIGTDPKQDLYVSWSFSGSRFIRTHPVSFIERLNERLHAKGDSVLEMRSAKWYHQIGDPPPQSLSRVYEALESFAPDLPTIFSEHAFDGSFLNFANEGTFFRAGPASVLGWALPASIGYSIADKSKDVTCIIGDGSWVFSNPVASLALAQSCKVGISIWILNNGGYGTVRRKKGTELSNFDFELSAVSVAKAMNVGGERLPFERLKKEVLNAHWAKVRSSRRSEILELIL